jgi:DNA-binding SARP family transcriptional activator/tetratricopeptide (TPR) repeat protein
MEFRILGPLEVADGRDHVPLGPEKQRAVLAMLLLEANHAVPVERLIDGLWADAPPERSVKAIHTYVSRLRKVVPAERLRTQPPGYSIEVAPDELDLDCFERLLADGQQALDDGDPGGASAALAQALGLWRGPPLAEFAEPFAAAERGRLEELGLRAREARIEADLALGRHTELVGELERLVSEHPLRERLYRQLMLALYRSGRQAEALTVFRNGRSLLVEQLGIEPSRALQELEVSILRHDPSLDVVPAARMTSRHAPREHWSELLVGREREIECLTGALGEALSGRGRLVLVSGEQGLGKTRVALELARHAERRGAQVLWGRCYEREGAPPYWPWVQVIRSYLRSGDLAGPGVERHAAVVAELVPELRERLPGLEPPPVLHEPKQERFRLLDAVASFLVRAARGRPLTIVLDDLHASDAGSLLLLEFVVRELADVPLLVIGTYRDVELTRGHRLIETLAELTRDGRVERLSLRGLTEPEVAELIDASLDAPHSDGLARRVHERTEGNPLFVTEVVRLLMEQTGSPAAEPLAIDGGAIRVPEGVRVVIGRRLDGLSSDCCETLQLAALVGREFGVAQLRTVTEARPDALDDLLEEALDAHVLEEVPEAPDRFRFTHRLVQETLITGLSTTKRVRAHADIARSLEAHYGGAADAHAAELVRHFAEGETVVGPTGVIRYSRSAGEQALVAHAYDEARIHFQRALDAKQGQPMDDETAWLLFGLARSEFAERERYDLDEPLGHLRRAFAHFAESGDEGTAVEIASYPIPYVYGSPGGAELAIRALPMVPEDSAEAGYLLSTLGWFRGMSDRAAAREAFARSASIAKTLADTTLERRVLISEAHVDFWHLAYDDCLRKALEAIELARRAQDERTEMVALSEAARMTATMGRPAEAEEHCDRMLRLAERFRERYWLVTARVNRLWLAVLRGEWQIARALGQEALALQPRDARSLSSLALVAAELGDVSEAESYVQRLLESRTLSSAGFPFEDACVAGYLPRIRRITASGMAPGVDEEAASAVLSSEVVVPLLELYVRAGRGFAAVQHADADSARSGYLALRGPEPVAPAFLGLSLDRLLGQLSATAGDGDATAHFESALAFCRRAGYLPELAWVAAELAETLDARGRPDDGARADRLREEARDVAARLDMRGLALRLP